MEQKRESGGIIVNCPACGARVRLDPARHGGKRLKLRCSRCGEVHQTEVPAAVPPVPVEKAGVQVLVAHSDPALCAAIGEILAPFPDVSWHACHSGDESLAMMERLLPDVAVIDVALPGLFAFELVDKVRQRSGLERVKLILLSSVYNKMAYKRTPNSLYGADDYIEKHHLPSDLVPKLRQLTGCRIEAGGAANPASARSAEVQLAGGQATGEMTPGVSVELLNSKLRHAESFEVEIAADAQQSLEKARRLARIIVSDIALYNQDRVEEGVRNGTFFSLLAAEVEEGRKLFAERVAADVPGSERMLQDTFEHFIERRRSELRRGH